MSEFKAGQFADETIAQIQAWKDDRFFIAVGFNKPHLPFSAPKKYWDMYDRRDIQPDPFQQMAENTESYIYSPVEIWSYTDISSSGAEVPIPTEKQRELIHGYYACVSMVDEQIGRILDELESQGVATNTIIVLWGDHGWHLGDHDLWCKHSTWEQACHAPLIFSYPGTDNPGMRTDAPAEFVDIFPTLCDLAGLPEPIQNLTGNTNQPLEGVSLVPLMEGEVPTVKSIALSQWPRGSNIGYSMRSRRYRCVLWVDKTYYPDLPWDKTIEDAQLFDMRNDPRETVNLADDPAYEVVYNEFVRLFRSGTSGMVTNVPTRLL